RTAETPEHSLLFPIIGWNGGNKRRGTEVRKCGSNSHLLTRGETMSKLIIHDHNEDGIDRRGLLQCMAWAGTGVIWNVASGLLTSQAFSQNMKAMKGELHFVQISDSHMGFNKPANPDVVATLQAAIDKINALPQEPDFIIHTGDLSHMSKPGEYDTLDQALKAAKPRQVFFVPGEHDTSIDDGKEYLARYGKNTKGR